MMMMEIMGDARSMEHPGAQGVRFTRGRNENEDTAMLEPLLTRL